MVYSKKYGLISIGDQRDNYKIDVLQFADQSVYDWKHVECKWQSKRCAVAAAFISDDKLICCGGGGNDDNRKLVDIYDFTTTETTTLCNLNEKRTYSGIYVDEYVNGRIYVGAGYYSDKSFEFYDATKNKWMLLANTNGTHRFWPIIWKDNPNVIHIASSEDCKYFEKLDIRQNKWMDYIKNESFDSTFGTEININSSSRLLMSVKY